MKKSDRVLFWIHFALACIGIVVVVIFACINYEISTISAIVSVVLAIVAIAISIKSNVGIDKKLNEIQISLAERNEILDTLKIAAEDKNIDPNTRNSLNLLVQKIGHPIVPKKSAEKDKEVVNVMEDLID